MDSVEQDPVETLRAAAARLREGPWWWVISDAVEPLADLLDGIATFAGTHDVPGPGPEVLAVAHAILGAAPRESGCGS